MEVWTMSAIKADFSSNANNMHKSVIRELLKLTQRPDIISFGGGLPAPETFPVQDLKAAADEVLTANPTKALQYGTTEGESSLVAELISYEARHGTAITPKNLLITSSSQQALDMMPKIFLDPGDVVISGRPTYVGAIQAIQSYRGKMLGIPFSADDSGFDMQELELRYSKAQAAGEKIKYIYVIPDFQNPSGICWSLQKRQALLDFSYREGMFIVEDAPYREIRFMGEQVPSIYQLDQRGRNEGNIIMLKTFSKILAPGTRIGWIMAREDIIDKLVTSKQSMDLCTSPFTQMWLAAYMKKGKVEETIANTCANYRAKRNYMIEMMDRYMPKRSDLKWTKPEGGLFLWITLPKEMDSEKLLFKAVERKVAYVVGSAFYFDEPEHNSMRINFSYATMDQIEEGIRRLSEVIAEELV
jgi:2-aminoadipate transaminase